MSALTALDLQRQLVEQVGVGLGASISRPSSLLAPNTARVAASLRSAQFAGPGSISRCFLAWRLRDQMLGFRRRLRRELLRPLPPTRRLACSTIFVARACASLMMSLSRVLASASSSRLSRSREVPGNLFDDSRSLR